MEAIMLPFCGAVPAGFPSPAADYLDDPIDLKSYLMPKPNSTYIFKTDGESMNGAYIPDKCYLIVDRSINARHNHIVVAAVNNEYTAKRLIKLSSGIYLYPENPKFKPQRITEEMDFRIFGVVTKIIIDPYTR